MTHGKDCGDQENVQIVRIKPYSLQSEQYDNGGLVRWPEQHSAHVGTAIVAIGTGEERVYWQGDFDKTRFDWVKHIHDELRQDALYAKWLLFDKMTLEYDDERARAKQDGKQLHDRDTSEYESIDDEAFRQEALNRIMEMRADGEAYKRKLYHFGTYLVVNSLQSDVYDYFCKYHGFEYMRTYISDESILRTERNDIYVVEYVLYIGYNKISIPRIFEKTSEEIDDKEVLQDKVQRIIEYVLGEDIEDPDPLFGANVDRRPPSE